MMTFDNDDFVPVTANCGRTSEYLRSYAFRLRPDDDAKPMRVRFELADAAEGELAKITGREGK